MDPDIFAHRKQRLVMAALPRGLAAAKFPARKGAMRSENKALKFSQGD